MNQVHLYNLIGPGGTVWWKKDDTKKSTVPLSLAFDLVNFISGIQRQAGLQYIYLNLKDRGYFCESNLDIGKGTDDLQKYPWSLR